MEEIKIKAQGVEIIASPFKHISSNEDENRVSKLKDIKGIQQQNNFTNQILGTISTQLNRIEGKSSTKTYKTENEEKETKQENPLFKPSKPLKLGGNRNDDLIKILTQKLFITHHIYFTHLNHFQTNKLCITTTINKRFTKTTITTRRTKTIIKTRKNK